MANPPLAFDFQGRYPVLSFSRPLLVCQNIYSFPFFDCLQHPPGVEPNKPFVMNPGSSFSCTGGIFEFSFSSSFVLFFCFSLLKQACSSFENFKSFPSPLFNSSQTPKAAGGSPLFQ